MCGAGGIPKIRTYYTLKDNTISEEIMLIILKKVLLILKKHTHTQRMENSLIFRFSDI